MGRCYDFSIVLGRTLEAADKGVNITIHDKQPREKSVGPSILGRYIDQQIHTIALNQPKVSSTHLQVGVHQIHEQSLYYEQ
jgi:hypothetical protein